MGELEHSATVVAPKAEDALNPFSPPESDLAVSQMRKERIPFRLAGILPRLAGFVIDNLTLTAAIVLIRDLIGLPALRELYDRGFEVEYWHVQAFCIVNYLVISFLYFAVLESSAWQATIGKRIMGIKVCDLRGHRLSFAEAAYHSFGRLLSFATFWTGFLFALLNRKRQTMHDRLAGCLVIQEEPDHVDSPQSASITERNDKHGQE